MIEDAGLTAVLTQEKLADILPETRAVKVLLDRDAGAIEAMPQSNLDVSTGADELIYVIYTSGSTGQPKGVAMRHGAIRNLIHWQIARWAETSGARTLKFASLNFDVATQEILATLCSGGALVLVSEETRRDQGALIAVLDRFSVRRLFLPFVALQGLAETAAAEKWRPASLREIVTAGEQLVITPALARLVRDTPGMRLENQYGPSETHVVTSWVAEDEQALENRLPPIGRPIANTQIYILDERGAPTPVGVTGEIYLGGEGVARGYLGRPDLTAQKFVRDHFSSRPGARMYRTGDLARYRADGNVEFLGRGDNQVKIRGFRIEPGEIEAVLGAHPAIDTAIVVARDDAPGGRRLVAYLVPSAGAAAPGVSELREFLHGKLPDYMIPAAFVTEFNTHPQWQG